MREHAKPEFQGAVLIADDHAVFRMGLMQLLQRRLKVTKFCEAGCFDEVLHLVESQAPSLALIDLRMPGLSGPGEIARVRALRPDTRVVVLSGSDAREDILDALSAGVHGYLVKTQPLDQLVDRLRYILSGEIYVPPVLAELPAALDAGRGGRSAAPPGRAKFSHRQLQVLGALVEGKSNREIAKALNVAEGTVKAHLAGLYKALGVSNRTRAAALGKQFVA
jgi:DNA-binding NarL/FixJ family response regulator